MLKQLYNFIGSCLRDVQCNHVYKDPRDGKRTTFRHACQKRKFHFGKHVGVGANPPTWNTGEGEID